MNFDHSTGTFYTLQNSSSCWPNHVEATSRNAAHTRPPAVQQLWPEDLQSIGKQQPYTPIAFRNERKTCSTSLCPLVSGVLIFTIVANHTGDSFFSGSVHAFEKITWPESTDRKTPSQLHKLHLVNRPEIQSKFNLKWPKTGWPRLKRWVCFRLRRRAVAYYKFRFYLIMIREKFALPRSLG